MTFRANIKQKLKTLVCNFSLQLSDTIMNLVPNNSVEGCHNWYKKHKKLVLCYFSKEDMRPTMMSE